MDKIELALTELKTWQEFAIDDLHGVVVCQAGKETDVILSPTRNDLYIEYAEYLDIENAEDEWMVETLNSETTVIVCLPNPHQLPLDFKEE